MIELLVALKTDMERIKIIESARKNQLADSIPDAYKPLLKK